VVEYVERQSGENQEIATEDVVQHLKSIIDREMNP
jgi:hypothetical protein